MPKRTRTSSARRSIFKRRWFVDSSILLLILIAGGVAAALFHHNHKPNSRAGNSPSATPNNKIDYSPASPADNTVNNNRKGSSDTSSTIDTFQSPPNTGTFSVTVTRAGVDSATQKLQVATLINGVTSGTCTLNVHQAGQSTVTQSEAVTQQVNSYVCPVFNVPLSDFPNRGSWNVSVTVTSGGKTASNNWADNPVSLGG